MASAGNTKSGSVMVIGAGIAGMQASLDLANSDFKVYTGWAIDVETGEKIEVPLRVPRKTKEVTELVEIVFDNHHVVRCTPDHPFRLKDGTYVSAAKLTPDMEIEDGIQENDSGSESVGS